MPRITISYRRDDSLDITGRIFERLAGHYGRESVFRDIDNIPPGVDFRKHIGLMLDESDIVLAIVGPKWIGPRVNQSRLANAADPVRVEIETALRKDRPLIPVLVQRARMPRVEQLPESMHDFAYRNAVQVDSGRDFDHHLAGLIRSMDRIFGSGAEIEAASPDELTAQAETASIISVVTDGAGRPEQGLPFKPDLEVIGEIESLRDANRSLEAQVAALARARDQHAREAASLTQEAAGTLGAKEEEIAKLLRQLAAYREAAAAPNEGAEEAANKLAEREQRIAALTAELRSIQKKDQTVRLKRYRVALLVMLLLLVGGCIVVVLGGQTPSEQLSKKEAQIIGIQKELSAVRSELSDAKEKAKQQQVHLSEMKTVGHLTLRELPEGVLVEKITVSTADLKLGDVITEINFSAIRTINDVRKQTQSIANSTVAVTVLRGGAMMIKYIPSAIFL